MRLALTALIIILAVPAAAATAQESCIEQQKALRADAVDSCSGLSYLFNPSGCFIAQKALNAFDSAACLAKEGNAIGKAVPDQRPPVTTTLPPFRSQVAPERAPDVPAPSPVAASPPGPALLPAAVPTTAAPSAPAPAPVADAEPGIAQLKAENARLKAEIERLKAEREEKGR